MIKKFQSNYDVLTHYSNKDTRNLMITLGIISLCAVGAITIDKKYGQFTDSEAKESKNREVFANKSSLESSLSIVSNKIRIDEKYMGLAKDPLVGPVVRHEPMVYNVDSLSTVRSNIESELRAINESDVVIQREKAKKDFYEVKKKAISPFFYVAMASFAGYIVSKPINWFRKRKDFRSVPKIEPYVSR